MTNQVFLAGVANAEIFDGDELFASARTLVDSSISIGVTAEDVRGGQGAQLLGKYLHTTSFGLKITDALFNIEYLAANVGAALEASGDVFCDESLTSSAAGLITLTNTAVAIRNGGAVFAYIKLGSSTSDTRTKYNVTVDNTVTGLTPNTEYCVRYMYNAQGSSIKISATFVPSTFHVVLTAPLFSGDANNPTTGTEVGSVTIDVPRFLLSGTQELSMSSTGVSQTSFEGSALASGGSGCNGKSIYATITQVMYDSRWYTGASGLVIEDNNVEVTVSGASALINTAPVVYAFYANGAPKMINNTIITAQESGLASDKKSSLVYSISAGATGLTINANTGVITGTPAVGTATIKVVAKQNDVAIPKMDASMLITIS